MAVLTGLTFAQKTWQPLFVEELNQDKCIGCGRCFKVCGRDVLSLIALNEDGEIVEDEEDEEIERKVMTIVNKDNCIGCQACSKICPKNCYTHTLLEV